MTDLLSSSDLLARLPELREIAEKATPGPWLTDEALDEWAAHNDVTIWSEADALTKENNGDAVFVANVNAPEVLVFDGGKANAIYIATFSPPTVLALLRLVEDGRWWPHFCQNDHQPVGHANPDDPNLPEELECPVCRERASYEEAAREGDELRQQLADEWPELFELLGAREAFGMDPEVFIDLEGFSKEGRALFAALTNRMKDARSTLAAALLVVEAAEANERLCCSRIDTDAEYDTLEASVATLSKALSDFRAKYPKEPAP